VASPAEQQRFFVEFELDAACPLTFLDNPSIVLFFQSWAFSARMGGQHELAHAANHLQRQLKIDLQPMYRYADRDVETPQDAQELEQSWQAPSGLAASARAIADAWETPDATLAPLVAGYEHLAARLRELAAMCDWGAARDARVRMSFDLREENHTPGRALSLN
jgi:hypothetical protein